ncbi:hypothetical protein GYH30_018909 [Glycine max]|uniref:Uncharacterized protein n=1 Tax=Glycine max TaxID=3847 RepID=A0A0R0J594_SOYBN|nr:hypothetical protein GYH30_018909 [Glycine max]
MTFISRLMILITKVVVFIIYKGSKQELIKGHQGSNEWEKRSNESNDENERLEGREREEPNRIVVKD